MAEVPDFQPDPNEKTVCMILQQKERKELVRLHKIERKATIEKYKQELNQALDQAVVGKSKGGPQRPSSVYMKGHTTPAVVNK